MEEQSEGVRWLSGTTQNVNLFPGRKGEQQAQGATVWWWWLHSRDAVGEDASEMRVECEMVRAAARSLTSKTLARTRQ